MITLVIWVAVHSGEGKGLAVYWMCHDFRVVCTKRIQGESAANRLRYSGGLLDPLKHC